MSDFAENLKKYRKRKGLSQTELAKSLHYGYTAIANYESGRNEPSFDCLIKLAEVLEVTLEELLGVEPKTKEKQLISIFRKLDEEKQNRILDLIEALQH